ncbi:MAG: peptidylprolyl isomerase [Prevotella sp.]|nr:peptidylprolyl isomerase [Prevotella sp.]
MNKHLLTLTMAVLFGSLVSVAQTSTTEVLLETTEGNIRIALYDETPLHRDNFLKLTRMHIYDSLLFHRVIKDFMIQSGDTNSKNAKPGQQLGTGDFDYTQEPEFRLPQIIHRRGCVAMAREPDVVNPEMRSSACQFYIVWGKRFSSAEIEKAQERLDTMTHGRVKLTPEMIKVYKSVGGTPHLDGQYTVFGEVTEGLDVVERIQKAETDDYDRPFEDIRILRATVTKDIPKSPVTKPAPKAPTTKGKKK